MILAEGTRILHKTGRLGTVVSRPSKHSHYRVRFDERKHSFEPEVAKVVARDMTPVDPKLHEKWEAAWPAFDQKTRGWARAGVAS